MTEKDVESIHCLETMSYVSVGRPSARPLDDASMSKAGFVSGEPELSSGALSFPISSTTSNGMREDEMGLAEFSLPVSMVTEPSSLVHHETRVWTLTYWKERLYIFAVSSGLFVMGWNDGSTGPLLLRIEQNYDVGFAIVSLLFISGFIGYLVAGILNVKLTDKYGFGKIVVLGAACQVLAAALESSAPPFGVFAVAFALNGSGAALLNSQANVFVASLPNSALKLSILHACYGIGAFVSPLTATQFAQARHWSYQYLFSMCLAIAEFGLHILVFRLKTQQELLGDSQGAENTIGSSANKLHQIFRLKAVHLLSFFVLVYVGLEVTIGGWIVTYLIEVRGSSPSAGYVSSGFFGGLTLGRVALVSVNKKVGARRVVFLYSFIVIALELIVWFVPSTIGDAIAVSIAGLLLGPFYPLAIGESSLILPSWLLAGAIGWIASFGQAGSAVFPFLTGVLAQKYGINVLQPLLVAMMVMCITLWWLVPHKSIRV